MARLIIVYGKSGSGKTRSLKNFGEDEITYFNVTGKRVPFQKSFKYEIKGMDYGKLFNGLTKMPTQVAVIDDAGYLQTGQFMAGHSQPKKGGNTFDLFNDIGDSYYNLIRFITFNVPSEKRVYMMMHEITNDSGDTKLRTIGKLLDEKVCIEGMTEIALRCMTLDGKHGFRTVTDGSDITKTPEGMFSADFIENDLKAVDEAIVAYDKPPEADAEVQANG